MKRLSLILALALLVASAPAQAPTNLLAIKFTNSGKGSAYVHWTLPPGLSTSPTAVNFGPIQIGSSASVTITLSNDGSSTIQLLPLSITGTNPADFTFVSQCPTYLQYRAPQVPGASPVPGQQCSIVVTFRPSAAGPRVATFTIPFAAMNSNPPASLGVSIAGKIESPGNLIARGNHENTHRSFVFGARSCCQRTNEE